METPHCNHLHSVLYLQVRNWIIRNLTIKPYLSNLFIVIMLLLHFLLISSRNWTTPITFDLKSGAVSLLRQAEKYAS